MITVVDYGMGNLGSILNMLRFCGLAAELSEDPDRVSRADKLILPGVGAFDRGMEGIRRRGLGEALSEAVVRRGVPVLGICLGMQLMARESEEGSAQGFGWLAATVVRFRLDPADASTRLPHMGWREVTPRARARLFGEAGDRFYFAHSYHIWPLESVDVAAAAVYGYEFPAAVERGNILGVQFHPEKSHRFGVGLFQRFSAI